MIKYWEKLLIKWRERGGEGLTLPFIIGSQKFLPHSHQIQEIKDFINDIINNDTIIFINYCDSIGDIIFGIKNHTRNVLLGYFPTINNLPQTKLFICRSVEGLGKTIEEIIQNLTLKYKNDIDNNKFSLNNGIKSDFNSEEIEFIKSCDY